MILGTINDMVFIASGEAANPLDAPADLALWTLIIFLGLLAVLTKFAWKPMMEGLETREKSIEDNILSAEQANEQAQANLRQYEEKLSGANDEAKSIIDEARQDAEAARERIVAEAKEAAQRQKDLAVADINAAKDQAVRELAEKSVDSAVSLAGSILGRSLEKNDHSKLIDDSIKRFTGAS